MANGSLFKIIAEICMGTPSRSLGTIRRGLLMQMEGLAPFSCKSIAISPPVLPAPTTSTFLFLNLIPFL